MLFSQLNDTSHIYDITILRQGKKKFSNKDGQKFYVLHRSQTDEAYAGDERPSDFVLVPAKDVSNRVYSHCCSIDKIVCVWLTSCDYTYPIVSVLTVLYWGSETSSHQTILERSLRILLLYTFLDKPLTQSTNSFDHNTSLC